MVRDYTYSGHKIYFISGGTKLLFYDSNNCIGRKYLHLISAELVYWLTHVSSRGHVARKMFLCKISGLWHSAQCCFLNNQCYLSAKVKLSYAEKSIAIWKDRNFFSLKSRLYGLREDTTERASTWLWKAELLQSPSSLTLMSVQELLG